MNNMDVSAINSYSITKCSLREYYNNPKRANAAAVILCESGSATIDVNLNTYILTRDTLFFLFPHDVLEVKELTSDFNTTYLAMSVETLGEASSRIEHIVFEKLHNSPFEENLNSRYLRFVKNTLENIQYFYEDNESTFKYENVMCQVRSLILTVSDNIKSVMPDEPATYSRLEEHFRAFMKLVTHNYKKSREVSFYADKMSITPKYLNFIVQSVARRTCKGLIDSYVIMQLKSELRNSEKAIQEIAYEYNFSNQSFLGSYFKKFVNVSPRAFRGGE